MSLLVCYAPANLEKSMLFSCSQPVGGAEHTIVEMPKSCGLGPYARVASLDVHPDQTVLSDFHAQAKPASESVFLLSFDYNFAAIPASNGPIYMRAGMHILTPGRIPSTKMLSDVTDMPGYW
jgi:hypothetical protein